MTMDHNICLAIDGRCVIITYLNGKPNWGVYKPGEYGDHNVIDRRGRPASLSTSIRPSSLRPQAET